ncbi:hypothetical protein BDA96_10G043700 [Sorghum bicolor]|uniref:Uncharacterized protein n=2 Tax=Sorghum bicolor TaxID=4558 RepID=C5Z3Y8_SORBI|nr:hypothetical protein SORBI_3010G037500 [Sorghum bicolor]KAG0512782.1 hypothetical protein BDA96_10G043700 [Sorghum bicolor]
MGKKIGTRQLAEPNEILLLQSSPRHARCTPDGRSTLTLVMLASNRRASASAVRRFPPGCGRPHNVAAGPPPYHRLPTTAAATTKTKPTLANPSARGGTNTALPPARRTLPATASFGAEAPDRGVGSGMTAVTVRRASAVRRYPPGCGRGVALSKPKPPDSSEGEVESEDGAGKPSAAVVGHGGPKASAWEDGEVMLRASELDGAKFSSNGGTTNGGDGDSGAQEEGGGKPWEVSGLMAMPFLPWAQHERRSQRASG